MLTLMIVALALAYLRGSRAVPTWRAVSFLLGLCLTWVAAASPIAALDRELLTFHMLQHVERQQFPIERGNRRCGRDPGQAQSQKKANRPPGGNGARAAEVRQGERDDHQGEHESALLRAVPEHCVA